MSSFDLLVTRIRKLDWDITSSEEAKAALKVLTLIKEVPASEIDKLSIIMNGFGKLGVLAWIDEVEASRKKETIANVTNYNVNAGGKLNIYIGDSSSSGKPRSSSGSRSNNAKSKGWQVKEGKAYLSDPWIALVHAVKKQGKQFKVEQGQQRWQYISFNGKAGRKLGNDAYNVAAFTLAKPTTHNKMVSVHTSEMSAGQGPEGYVLLAKALYDEAKEKGFVKEGGEEVKASSDEPVAEESTTKAENRAVDSLEKFDLGDTMFELDNLN